MKKIIKGKNIDRLVSEALGPYTHGVQAEGKMIFTAGQVALVNGEVVGKDDIGVQYRQILNNIKGILTDAGGSMDNLVKLVHYVTIDVTPGSEEYASIVDVRKEFIKNDFPVSSLVKVAGLMVEGLLIEVDAYAVID